MPGEFITCPDCKGWPSCETGMLCTTCGDDGQVWNETDQDRGERSCCMCQQPRPAMRWIECAWWCAECETQFSADMESVG